MRRAVSCITRLVVNVRGGYHPSEKPHTVLIGDGLPVSLAGPGLIKLRLVHHYRIIHVPGERGPWRVRTAAAFSFPTCTLAQALVAGAVRSARRTARRGKSRLPNFCDSPSWTSALSRFEATGPLCLPKRSGISSREGSRGRAGRRFDEPRPTLLGSFDRIQSGVVNLAPPHDCRLPTPRRGSSGRPSQSACANSARIWWVSLW